MLLKDPKGLSNPSKDKSKEGISLAGISNAALANIATDIGKSIFTKVENRPATKGDIQALLNKNTERYILVKNIPKRFDGASAYFDTESKQVVHLKILPQWK